MAEDFIITEIESSWKDYLQGRFIIHEELFKKFSSKITELGKDIDTSKLPSLEEQLKDL